MILTLTYVIKNMILSDLYQVLDGGHYPLKSYEPKKFEKLCFISALQRFPCEATFIPPA